MTAMDLFSPEERAYLAWKHPKQARRLKKWTRKTCQILLCPIYTCTCAFCCLLEWPWPIRGRRGPCVRQCRPSVNRAREGFDIKIAHRQRQFERRSSLSESKNTTRPRKLPFSDSRPGWFSMQLQSDFFNRLPAEIRMRIYSFVINDEPLLHLAFDSKRFDVHKCSVGSPLADKFSSTNDEDEGEPEIRSNRNVTRLHLECLDFHEFDSWKCSMYYRSAAYPLKHYQVLPLLKSCRRVYTEAIDLLYLKNTFMLSIGYNFHTFVVSIPERHVVSLRSLVLHLPPYDREFREDYISEQWDATKSVLKRMSNLKTCRIIVREEHGWILPDIMEFLKSLSTKDSFIVDLTRRDEAAYRANLPSLSVLKQWHLKDLE